MKGAGRRQKGSRFEREAAEMLNRSLGTQMKRTPLSGALEWLSGDIFEPYDKEHIVSSFMWECKHHKTWELHKWMEKAKLEAMNMGKRPIVIARRNHEDALAILSFKDLIWLFEQLEAYKKEANEKLQ